MLSVKQCELARLMTNDTTSNQVMQLEHALMPDDEKQKAAEEIKSILKVRDVPFDKALPRMFKDFSEVASKYNIKPATLFCVLIDRMSSK